VEILSKYPGYAELNARTIVNWKESSLKPKQKTGRKVNDDFEAAVWANLMICQLEQKVSL
jgi:hypothetical protein